MRIGVDLGGTKTEIVALSSSGQTLFRQRVASPRHDYQATLDNIVALVRQAEQVTGNSGTIGIGIPGTISPETGLIKNANSTWLNGRPLQTDLEARLGQTVRIANDANCFTVSEAVDGAAEGAHLVFGVIIGTGTGGGIAIDGRVHSGINAIGGEWGHNPLPWPNPDELPGPQCYCGKKGCIETWLSGPGLQRDHQATAGEVLSGAQLVEAAEAGNRHAETTLQHYEDRLARSLATVINLLDPDVIVLGGGVSNMERLYRTVPGRLKRYVFSDHVETPVRPAKHGDASGVRGAAWLWNEST